MCFNRDSELYLYAYNDLVANIAPAVTTSTKIEMQPNYSKEAGTDAYWAGGWGMAQSFNDAFANIPAVSIDFGMMHVALSCDFSNLNSNTKHICVPMNGSGYDITNKANKSGFDGYIYPTTLDVVTTYVGSTSLDGYFTEILLKGQSPHLVVWLQRHLDELCLTVGIGGEITDARLRRSHRDIVLPVAGHGSHVEALDVAHTRVAILVADIIYRALVVLLEHIQIDDFRLAMVALAAFSLTHKHFLRHLDNLVSSIAVENDDVVNVRTVRHELILLQSCSDESLGTIDIEFLIRLCHLRCLNRIERTDFSETRVVGSIFLLQVAEPLCGHLRKTAR